MARIITVAAAQLGPIARSETRGDVVKRLLEHMRAAHAMNCDLIVYPELALTTFFPRWYMEDQAEIDSFFEAEMPGPETRVLFETAADLGIGFNLGYAELIEEDGVLHRYNTSILVDKKGQVVGKYRKVHLPGHAEHEPYRRFQHLEKRYFEPGKQFDVWRAFDGIIGMAICNDRRWPETYRVMGLQGVEMILLGYNTPVHNPPTPEHDNLSIFHNNLVMQSGAYQNGTWVVGVAKGGCEEGVDMICGSSIIAPSGEIVAACTTYDDELAVARCDLDLGYSYKKAVFNFDVHRQLHAYQLITQQRGAVPPPE